MPWTAARTTEMLRQCPLAIAQQLLYCTTAVSTAVRRSHKDNVCSTAVEPLALHSAFWISTEVVTALFGCYMASATWNCCRLGAISVYTMQPCTSLQCHAIRSHIRRMRLAVTSTSTFRRMTGIFLRGTAVIRRLYGYRNKSQRRKLTGEKISPAAPAGTRTRRITSPSLYHWAIPVWQRQGR